jgi:hypothetical protein
MSSLPPRRGPAHARKIGAHVRPTRAENQRAAALSAMPARGPFGPADRVKPPARTAPAPVRRLGVPEWIPATLLSALTVLTGTLVFIALN